MDRDILLEVNINEAGYDSGIVKLENINLVVKRGQLTGLIGPNGAGKSTTLKCILGMLPFTDAEVKFSGASDKYAYVPEQPVFYEKLTLWEHLNLAAAVYEMDEIQFEQEAQALLEKFAMSEVRDHLPESFSKGMRQKMMLMLGFLTKPDVYIVDEPFIGLDPRATKDFLHLLEEECKRGAGVLMSTHVLDTAERICHDFVLISEGKVAAAGTLHDIREAAQLPDASLFDCFDVLT
jgi:ABC-2 type transport system ATP-binding protein